MNGLFTIGVWIGLTAWLLGSSLATESLDGPSSTHNPERAKNLIVVVSGDLSGTNDVFGAGIIVGMDADYLYIATANHVVRRGPREATNLKVEFQFLAGRVDAELEDVSDNTIDLAVLRVDRSQRTISIDEIPFDLLGSSEGLQRADSVYTIGHPEGERWVDSLDPDRFERHDGLDLVFRSQTVAEGHSGGGLFDAQWRLVGMVKKHTTIRAVATNIERIVEKLEDWRYPINLSHSGTPGGDIRNTKIAFESYRDGNAEIYVMAADGTNQRRLTKNTADDGIPAWSPFLK